jgi:hypothetical protein
MKMRRERKMKEFITTESTIRDINYPREAAAIFEGEAIPTSSTATNQMTNR